MTKTQPQKWVIFGARQMGQEIARHFAQGEIIAFIDGDPNRHGTLCVDQRSFPVYAVEKIAHLDFDVVFIPSFYNLWIQQATAMLKKHGVPEHKIWHKNKYDAAQIHLPHFARQTFICESAQLLHHQNVEGAVAELGVFQGDTAQIINAAFSRPFYLFDTFIGFDARDLAAEKEKDLSGATSDDFKATSLEIVQQQMPHLERCHFVSGFFPQSAQNLPADLRFAFVNIDADLYAPILAGLEWFYPRLNRGGLILIHDYFNSVYPGASKAVDEFCQSHKLFAHSIGDSYSVFICKN